MTEKRKIDNTLLGVIITAGVALLTTILTLVFTSGSKSSDNAKINIEKNEGGVKLAERDINEYHIHKDSIPPPPIPTYKLVGSRNSDLIKRLEEDNKLNITASGEHTISVTFSGSLKPLANSSTVFYYKGGHVVVTIDGDECVSSPRMPLPELQAGSKEQLTATLKSEINKHVDGSTNIMAAAILKCLE